MFNKTYVDAGYRGPSKIEVIEKRAPTDESVRLLSEMEQAALDKVLFSKPIEAAQVKGSVTHMMLMGEDGVGSVLYVSFAINEGRRRVCQIKLKRRTPFEDEGEYAKYLVQEVAQAIAVELLTKSEDVHRHIMDR